MKSVSVSLFVFMTLITSIASANVLGWSKRCADPRNYPALAQAEHKYNSEIQYINEFFRKAGQDNNQATDTILRNGLPSIEPADDLNGVVLDIIRANKAGARTIQGHHQGALNAAYENYMQTYYSLTYSCR